MSLSVLRAALVRLEGQGRSRVSTGRRNRKPAAAPTRSASRARAAKPARAPRGQNKAKVLDALKAGPMTASEIAKVTGISTATDAHQDGQDGRAGQSRTRLQARAMSQRRWQQIHTIPGQPAFPSWPIVGPVAGTLRQGMNRSNASGVRTNAAYPT
jgi:hypothetical protein